LASRRPSLPCSLAAVLLAAFAMAACTGPTRLGGPVVADGRASSAVAIPNGQKAVKLDARWHQVSPDSLSIQMVLSTQSSSAVVLPRIGGGDRSNVFAIYSRDNLVSTLLWPPPSETDSASDVTTLTPGEQLTSTATIVIPRDAQTLLIQVPQYFHGASGLSVGSLQADAGPVIEIPLSRP
jgi:hypothetical protein